MGLELIRTLRVLPSSKSADTFGQTIANHSSPRTTKRRSNEISLDEVEKIAI
jgi:hypothetical protein